MALSHPVPQIQVTQIGPVSSGVVMMSLQEAEPYLKAGQGVSQEPLAPGCAQKARYHHCHNVATHRGHHPLQMYAGSGTCPGRRCLSPNWQGSC